jgi:Ser/Thr protein kinase RdoA (MazF antagonist)
MPVPSQEESSSIPYSGLTPEVIFQGLESAGFRPDGSLFALNSYENRVYQIGIEDDTPLVAKFYRPGRWSDEAILEEHQFSQALALEEIPVIAPLRNPTGESLFHFQGYRFALFPRRGGRWPELENPEVLEWIGRFLGRIHQLGSARPFSHRPILEPNEMGRESADYLLESGLLPPGLDSAYRQLTERLMERIEEEFHALADHRRIRLHGDCHPGNILWTDHGPHFVDMDDCRTGPAIQDLWMLLSGENNEMALQLSYIREGYETFRPLDTREIALIEPLRTLRMIHYAAWLARRWTDPAFPAAFPWFGSHNYWNDHITSLQHQEAALERPPLAVY